jgi:hypothetical protein
MPEFRNREGHSFIQGISLDLDGVIHAFGIRVTHPARAHASEVKRDIRRLFAKRYVACFNPLKRWADTPSSPHSALNGGLR